MVPAVPVLAFLHSGPVPVWARSITGTGIKWCQYRYWHICSFVQYQYWNVTLPVLPVLDARTGIGMLVLWFITSLARSISGTGIKWYQYRYRHLCILVQYQYWHGISPVRALNGARAGIGISALWSSTSMGAVHYRYWH
jgi:hypothetical protein